MYAFSIASMLKSPYHDQVFFHPDHSWWIQYSPKSGGMDTAVNRSLIRCMTDREPVLVLKQVADKTSQGRARHRLLGLGYVENFDVETDLFRIRGLKLGEINDYLGISLADDLLETALRLESLEEWVPYVNEDRAIYRVPQEKRDTVFRGIVLENYDFTCAVTGQRFRSRHHIEATAAHIIRRARKGTDDPRNGLALSQSTHWAFDQGIFTISDQYEVVINPKARGASYTRFPVMDCDRNAIRLPKDEYYYPHPEALEWHRKEVFSRFEL